MSRLLFAASPLVDHCCSQYRHAPAHPSKQSFLARLLLGASPTGGNEGRPCHTGCWCDLHLASSDECRHGILCHHIATPWALCLQDHKMYSRWHTPGDLTWCQDSISYHPQLIICNEHSTCATRLLAWKTRSHMTGLRSSCVSSVKQAHIQQQRVSATSNNDPADTQPSNQRHDATCHTAAMPFMEMPILSDANTEVCVSPEVFPHYLRITSTWTSSDGLLHQVVVRCYTSVLLLCLLHLQKLMATCIPSLESVFSLQQQYYLIQTALLRKYTLQT